MSSRALFTSASSNWLTPPEVVDPLIRFAGGPVALDPCSHPQSIVPATARWSLTGTGHDDAVHHFFTGHGGPCDAHDGLSMMWACGGPIFVNPPYGRALSRWAQKVATEAHLSAEASMVATRRGVEARESGQSEILTLVPARTDTAWWRELTRSAACWLAWSGRLRFLVPGAGGKPGPMLDNKGRPVGAPFPAALVYHGPRWARFCDVFGDKGVLYRRLP